MTAVPATPESAQVEPDEPASPTSRRWFPRSRLGRGLCPTVVGVDVVELLPHLVMLRFPVGQA